MAEAENITAPVQAQGDVKPAVQSADGNDKSETQATSVQDESQDSKPANGDSKSAGDTKTENATDSVKDTKSGDRYIKDDRNGRDDRGGRGGRGGGRGRYQKFGKKDYRASFENLPETDDPEEIRKQVEFYFSDANLPQDRFLFELSEGYKNNPIPIKTIHNFKRMKRFQPYSAIVKALQDSDFLDVVNNNEDIKRKQPLDESYGTEYNPNQVKIYEDSAMSRSIYAKGFGKEYDSIQTEIESFFEPYGPVKQVRLRRIDNSGYFKGSVFVEFESDDLAQQFLELDPKPAFKEGEQPLKVMSKKEYVETKADEVKEGKIRPNEGKTFRGNGRDRGRGGRGRGGRGGDRNRDRDDRRGGDRGDRDRDDWRGRREDFQKGRRNDDRRGNKRDRDDGEDARDRDEKKGKADDVASEPKANDTDANNDKKRAREDDNEAPGSPVKKAKAEEATAA